MAEKNKRNKSDFELNLSRVNQSDSALNIKKNSDSNNKRKASESYRNVQKTSKVSSSSSNKRKKKKKKTHPAVKVLKILGATLLSLFLIVVITGSIVTTALTIYIMKFANDDEFSLNLDSLEDAYNTVIYAYDSAGNEFEVKELSNEVQRIWVSIDKIPQHVQDAYVYTEDERFNEHDGVDWKRTFSSFANLFLHLYDTKQGGSTITQQLIKNVTGDDANEGSEAISRKTREIFRAIQLEKEYKKDEILEAYLNYIGLNNGNICGVQAASKYYFNKDVSELTIAQAAVMAAIPKDPVNLDPFYNFEDNRIRQLYVLKQMYENGAIDYEEYQNAKNEEIVLYYDEEDPDSQSSVLADSYYVDAVIDQVTQDLMAKYKLDEHEAISKLSNSGYKIYANVDLNIQNAIEQKYQSYANFTAYNLSENPQSSFICMDYNGNVKALVGGIGDKTVRGYNRATMATRPPGSTIKPIACYAPAIDLNYVTWSTGIQDSPLMNMIQDGTSAPWPNNYSRTFSYSNVFVYMGLQRSLNTIPSKIINMMGTDTSFTFMESLNYTTLVENRETDNGLLTDNSIAPLTLGALTDGVILMEHCAAYQMFGNGGYYHTPKTYSKVVNAAGDVILQADTEGKQMISSQTAWVMNRMLKTVVEGYNGTAKQAKLNTVELSAKTGTSDDHNDYYFVGLTPEYLSAMWCGFDNPSSLANKVYDSPVIWKNIFGDIAEAQATKTFTKDPDVVEAYFCTYTGKLAKSSCPGTSLGYYKSDNVPGYCTSH